MRLKVLLIVAFVTLLLLGRNFSYGSNHILTNSKENVSLAFIEQFQEDFSFSIELPKTDDSILQAALTPRDATQLNGSVVPQSFPGVLLLYSLLAFVLPLLTPLIFTLILFFYYKIVREFFSEPVAFFSSVLLFLLPTFFYLGTNLISDDLLSLLFLLVGSHFFIQKKHMPLSAFLLGMAIFIRLPNAIWVLPILLFALFKIKDRSYFPSLKTFFYSIFTFLIPISLIFILNQVLYGGFLQTGYQIQYPILSQLVGTETGLFKSNFNDFWLQIKHYLFFLYPLPLILAAISFYKFHKKQHRHLLMIFGTFLGIFLLLTYQYAGSIFWGHDMAALNSSFMRYVLPFYLVLPVLTVYAIEKWSKNMQIVLGLLLVMSFVLTSLFFRGGLFEKWSQEEYGLELQITVLAQTNSQTLVMTRFHDKFIFPLRQTVTLPLLRSDIAHGYGDISPWLTPLDYQQIAQTMTNLKENNIDFILLGDPKLDISRLQKHLKNSRLAPAFTAQKTAAYKLIDNL